MLEIGSSWFSCDQPLKSQSLSCSSCWWKHKMVSPYPESELLWISQTWQKAGLPTRWSAFIVELNSYSRKEEVFILASIKNTVEGIRLSLHTVSSPSQETWAENCHSPEINLRSIAILEDDKYRVAHTQRGQTFRNQHHKQRKKSGSCKKSISHAHDFRN